MDLIQDGVLYMKTPPELFRDISDAFVRDSDVLFVRLYHNPKTMNHKSGQEEEGWMPVPFSTGMTVVPLEQEMKDANEKGWNYVATLTSKGCGNA